MIVENSVSHIMRELEIRFVEAKSKEEKILIEKLLSIYYNEINSKVEKSAIVLQSRMNRK